MKKIFYTASFNVVKGAEAVQNARVFSIATKVPSDCEGMKTIPELAPGWDIVGPYKKAEKDGCSDMAEAQKVYEKAYWNNVLKALSPDIIPDGSILCCYENAKKFCHRQTVARWATWADENVEYGGELDTAKKVFDVINADVQTDLNFEETIEMKEVNTDTIVTTIAENNTIEKEETIKMTNIENKAAEVRKAIEAASVAELDKIEATKKYVALRDAARAAMAVKKLATCKHQIANAKVRLLKAEFSVIEINGKIKAAVEAGKATAALEKRLTKAQERIAKAQERTAALEEKLAGLTDATEAVTEETPAVVEQATVKEQTVEEPVIEEPLFNHMNKIEIAVDLIAKKAAIEALHAELDELDTERIAEGDWIEKDDPVIVEEPTVVDDPVVENDDELDLIVETEGDSEEPEEAVSFAAPKVVKAEGLLKGKTVVGTVEEPKAETTTAAATSLQEIIAKRATAVAAPETVTVPVKQKTVTAPVAPKPFVPVNPFKNVGVAAPAPIAKTTSEDDGWVINDPIEFDEEIELELGLNPDGSKTTWGTWALEQTADEVEIPEEGQLIPRDDGTFDTPIVKAWFIHGATGTKGKRKNFRDSFLNNDVYDDIKLENAYNFGDESCTDHDAIMDEIYG